MFNEKNEPCCIAGCDAKPDVLAAVGFMRSVVLRHLRPECGRFYEYMCGEHYDRLVTDRSSYY